MAAKGAQSVLQLPRSPRTPHDLNVHRAGVFLALGPHCVDHLFELSNGGNGLSFDQAVAEPSGSPSRSPANDPQPQIRQPANVAVNHIAAHHRPDVLGWAAVDDVAGLQLEGGGQATDLFGHVPDHLAQVGALFGHAVDLEPDRRRGRVAQQADRVQRADGGRHVEALADFPGLFLVAHRALQVARRCSQDTVNVHRELLTSRKAPDA